MWLKRDNINGYHCIRNIQFVYIDSRYPYDIEKNAVVLEYVVTVDGLVVKFETKAEAEQFFKNLMIAVRFANSPSLDRIAPPYIVTVDELKNKEWW